MAAVPERQRIAELRRLGASEPLVRLSSGEVVHEAFRHSCLGPPYYVYHGARTPGGPPVMPLWDWNDTVVAAWANPDGPQFIEFSIEADDGYTPLARTEQGFWATRFDFLYECELPAEELRAAAAVVGYRFLDQYLSARASAEGRLRTFDGHRAWLRVLVADIDRESGSRAGG